MKLDNGPCSAVPAAANFAFAEYFFVYIAIHLERACDDIKGRAGGGGHQGFLSVKSPTGDVKFQKGQILTGGREHSIDLAKTAYWFVTEAFGDQKKEKKRSSNLQFHQPKVES